MKLKIANAVGLDEFVKNDVPIAGSLLGDEIKSVLEPLKPVGWCRDQKFEFEEKWSAFTGAAHSIAVTSCTSGLHLSLAAAGFIRR